MPATFVDKATRIFVVESCVSCGCLFGLEESMRNRLLITHDDFHCPNGHKQHFIAETEAQRLRKALDRSQSQTLAWQDQCEASDRQRAAYKGHLTRLKKRAKLGLCPCCDKRFKDLEGHMEDEHPAFGKGRKP